MFFFEEKLLFLIIFLENIFGLFIKYLSETLGFKFKVVEFVEVENEDSLFFKFLFVILL